MIQTKLNILRSSEIKLNNRISAHHNQKKVSAHVMAQTHRRFRLALSSLKVKLQ